MKKEIKTLLEGYEYKTEEVPLSKILVDTVATSEGMEKSLTVLGHASDVVLNKLPILDQGKEYSVIDGRKVINTLLKAKKKTVKARIYWNLPVDVAMYILLVKNLQRSPSPIVEAEAIQELMQNHNKTQKEIAATTGINPSVISQRLSLLRLPKPIIEQLRKRQITESVARRIVTLPQDVQNKIVKEEKITGEVVERYHRKFLNEQLAFDDMDLPDKVRGTATVRNYQVTCGDMDKKMTRKELVSYLDTALAGLTKESELIIKRI